MSNSPSYDRDIAIIEQLRTEIPSKKIFYSRVDGDALPSQYVIIQPFGGPEPEGDLGSTVSNWDCRYVAQCYGQDERTVQWMRDAVHRAMRTVTAAVAGVQWVRPGESGAIVPAGQRHYVVNDVYYVRV